MQYIPGLSSKPSIEDSDMSLPVNDRVDSMTIEPIDISGLRLEAPIVKTYSLQQLKDALQYDNRRNLQVFECVGNWLTKQMIGWNNAQIKDGFPTRDPARREWKKLIKQQRVVTRRLELKLKNQVVKNHKIKTRKMMIKEKVRKTLIKEASRGCPKGK